MDIRDLLDVKKGEKVARMFDGLGAIIGGVVFLIVGVVMALSAGGNILDNITMFIIPIIGGVIFIIIGIVRMTKVRKKTKTDEFMESRGETGSDNPEAYLNRDFAQTAGQTASYTPDATATFDKLSDGAKKYYFLTDKKLSQGYYMEDENRQVVYKAPMVKNNLFGPCDFEFTNMLTGSSKIHKVGHTVTSETNDITTDSGFTFDGVDVWERIKSLGVIIDTEGNILKPVVKVYRGKALIGIIESSGVKVHEEEAKGFMVQNLVVKGFYRIQADPKDMEVVFFVAFAITRSEKQVYVTD